MDERLNDSLQHWCGDGGGGVVLVSIVRRDPRNLDYQGVNSYMSDFHLSTSKSSSETQANGRCQLVQLQTTEAVGRLVIEFDKMTAGSRGDLELRDGDRLMVPKKAQEVTVIGETQQNTWHLFQAGLSREDYISLSGGLTRRADKKLIYVVRASGAVITGSHSKWFSRKNVAEIRPGDTIVVPLEVDRIRPLAFWGSVKQILYQGAIAVAAVKTFNP